MKNSFLKKVAPMLAVFALVISVLNFGSYDPYNELAVLTPEVAQAQFALPDLEIPGFDFEPIAETDFTTANYTSTFTSCDIKASASSVESGSSVTLTWTTAGLASVTINGEAQDALSGSRTFHNIQQDTTYTLVAKSADGKTNCTSKVTVGCVPPVVLPPKCTLTPANTTITSGQSVDLTWTTTNAASASLTSFGNVALSGTQNTGALTSAQNYTLTAVGTDGQTVTCHSAIAIKPQTQVPSCPISQKDGRIIVNFTGQKLLSNKSVGESQTNFVSAPVPAGTYDITLASWDGYAGRETVSQAFEIYKVNMFANTTLVGVTGTISDLADNVIEDTNVEKVNSKYVLTTAISAVQAKHAAYPNNTSANSLYPICIAFDPIVEEPQPVPSCDAFTAAPTIIQKGQSTNLSWSTTNAARVVIDNAIGQVAATGTVSVSPLQTTTYTLTAFGVADKKQTCTATVTVKDVPVETLPKCESFTATPATTPVGGGSVNLAWSTKDATTVSISPTIGTVSTTGTTSVNVATTTTYTLTAANADGKKDTCSVTIVVPPPIAKPITCADNVTISVADSTIRRGNSTTLSWSTTGITGVSFNNGISSTALSGTVTVSPNESTTYTLTATDGKTSVACPVTVRVETGGGGGGSNAPRCELEVSKTKIKRGDSVVLTWDSTRATDLFIEDQTEDRKIVTTIGLSNSKKDDLFEGKITVSPKEDTRYLLTVKRGSSTRTCDVKVEVDNPVTFTQIRDQQPLVSGISLTEVPYTGFEAGPILTLLFYALLMAWALYVAYLIVIRRDMFGGLSFATTKPTPKLIPEQIRPDVFVAKVQAPEMPVSTLPANLPTGGAVVGYANAVQTETVVSTNVHNIDDAEMTAIENQAHAERVLLSSDAIRHFIATTNNVAEREAALSDVIKAAKAQFPAEDGWIVLNEKRMQDLCVVCAANAMHSSKAPYIPAVIPEGSGSLAEAIVTGNVVAAYEMIGGRPMFALADAAADLDAVYRLRRGETGVASELLMKETAKFSEEQILSMIQALTGALDGTYTDEASAVKMAIMKAIKAAA